MKITNHTIELRRRISLDCSSPILTDQSHKAMCDINNIMKQYAKTGLLPNRTDSSPRYIDNTLVPSLGDAHNIIDSAMQKFHSLPPNILKLINHDPSQLEAFINDPNNKQILIMEGLLIPDESPPTPTISARDNIPPSSLSSSNIDGGVLPPPSRPARSALKKIWAYTLLDIICPLTALAVSLILTLDFTWSKKCSEND